jgi:hypothetical protein
VRNSKCMRMEIMLQKAGEEKINSNVAVKKDNPA